MVKAWLKTVSIMMTVAATVLIKLLKMDIWSMWLDKAKVTGVIIAGTKLQKWKCFCAAKTSPGHKNS